MSKKGNKNEGRFLTVELRKLVFHLHLKNCDSPFLFIACHKLNGTIQDQLAENLFKLSFTILISDYIFVLHSIKVKTNVIWSGISVLLRGKLSKFVFGFCCANSVNNKNINMTQTTCATPSHLL